MYQVVLDTNVLVAALRSNRGASFRLLATLPQKLWRPNLTVALVLEYEAVLKRDCDKFGLERKDIDDVIDGLCAQAGLHRIYFQWRPAASDPDDDLVIEAAIASRSDFILTYNHRDLRGAERFGIRCLSPKDFLIMTGELL
jgi:putative PIN family toxin of toxin-antitoxin system